MIGSPFALPLFPASEYRSPGVGAQHMGEVWLTLECAQAQSNTSQSWLEGPCSALLCSAPLRSGLLCSAPLCSAPLRSAPESAGAADPLGSLSQGAPDAGPGPCPCKPVARGGLLCVLTHVYIHLSITCIDLSLSLSLYIYIYIYIYIGAGLGWPDATPGPSGLHR